MRFGLALLAVVVLPSLPDSARAETVRQPQAVAGWLLTGAMRQPRKQHDATLLADGRVLVCGGEQDDGPKVWLVPGCALWNPETERWSDGGTLARPRGGLTGARLSDGRVAFFGGFSYLAPSLQDVRYAVDVWDPASNTATAAGLLPFPTQHPLVARLGDGRVLVVDDQRLRAATWNPADGTASPEETPRDAGRPLGLFVDRQGTLTLVLGRLGCREVAIWRRGSGARWTLAHVDGVSGCAGARAVALDDLRIAHWWASSWMSPTTVLVWNASSGAVRSVEIANPIPFESLLSLGTGGALELDQISARTEPMRGASYLSWSGQPWRFAGFIDHGGNDTFTPLPDGRVLMVGPAHARVWTPWTFSTSEPCRGVTAQIEDALNRPWSAIDVPASDNVSPACRAQISADPGSRASRALKELAQRPGDGGGPAGVQALCALGPAWAMDTMIRGLGPDASQDRGATCLAALADSDQFSARQAVDGYIEGCGHGDRPCEALPGAMLSSERARLRAAEIYAAVRRENGDGSILLGRAVCQGTVPKPAVTACRRADEAQEPEWRREQRRRAWLETGAVTAVGAGLAVGGFATRNDDTGRGFAIAAGALGLGAVFASPILVDDHGPMAGFAAPLAGFLAVIGGLVGGGVAALASANPGGSRAAISITGGVLFTTASLVPIWHF
ncbi:MAG TPA: hypothetical protein VKZ18_25995 [Polyangia bacterium]|nr:hypothetical protein [Polyangia bacterium]